MLRYETTLTIKDHSQSRWYNKYQHLDIKHCVTGQKLGIYIDELSKQLLITVFRGLNSALGGRLLSLAGWVKSHSAGHSARDCERSKQKNFVFVIGGSQQFDNM